MEIREIPIRGMHCRSCEITLTDSLEKISGVAKAEVSLKNKNATIYSKKRLKDSSIKRAIENAGYKIGQDKDPILSKNPRVYRDLVIGVIIITLALAIISRTGIADINTGSIASQGLLVALLVGLTAGLSTCMALVGGLVLGLSAKYSKIHPKASAAQKFKPHLIFNLSRIVSFFILGGLVGLLGSMFQLNSLVLGILTILVGVVMFVLGLQLTNLFPRLSSGGLVLPPSVSKKLGLSSRVDSKYTHRGAVTLGALSFFLPCGFTQAMQLYAISTGDFMTGAAVMGLFAIGTAPGLLGIGGLTSAVTGSFAKSFFRVAGVAVIVFAVINLSNGLNLTGAKSYFNKPNDDFTFEPIEELVNPPAITEIPGTADTANVLKTTFEIPEDAPPFGLVGDIYPNTFNIARGETYTLEVDSKDNGVGCMSTMMIPGLVNEPQFLREDTTHEFTFKADRKGRYEITCAMGVPFGYINVF
jgi:uncharacterized protein